MKGYEVIDYTKAKVVLSSKIRTALTKEYRHILDNNNVIVGLVGCGVANLAVAFELLKNGCDPRSITFIEKGYPFQSFIDYPTHVRFTHTREQMSVHEEFEMEGEAQEYPNRCEYLTYLRKSLDYLTEKGVSIMQGKEVVSLRGQDSKQIVMKDVYTGLFFTGQATHVVVGTGAYHEPKEFNLTITKRGGMVTTERYFVDADRLSSFSDIVIVGGGNSSVEAAYYLSKKSCNITMIVRESSLAKNVAEPKKDKLIELNESDCVTTIYNTELSSIDEVEGIAYLNDGSSVECDLLLLLTGYDPDLKMMEHGFGIEMRNRIGSDGSYRKVPLTGNKEESPNGLFVVGACSFGQDASGTGIITYKVQAKKVANGILGLE